MEKLIFAGTPRNAAETLQSLVANGYEIALVITREDALVGRKRELKESAVAEAARLLALPIVKANKITPEVETAIIESGAKLAVVVAFGALLRESTINLLELGWFNLHYSVLPRWRGASPVQSALAAGDRTTGVTLFQIDRGMDTGPICGVAETVIEPGENAGRLLERLTQLGNSLLLQELPRIISRSAKLEAQTGHATFAEKLNRDDARILTSMPAAKALNAVLAYNPEPGAWLNFNDSTLKVLEARLNGNRDLKPGELILLDGKVLLGFNASTLELLEVQPAGKKPMPAMDWFRGTKQDERRIS